MTPFFRSISLSFVLLLGIVFSGCNGESISFPIIIQPSPVEEPSATPAPSPSPSPSVRPSPSPSVRPSPSPSVRPSPSPSVRPSPSPSPSPTVPPINGSTFPPVFAPSFPAPVAGKTFYARPAAAKGTYGREDGSSYDNAFNGLTDMSDIGKGTGIKWGAGGVQAGTTLYICDSHSLQIPSASTLTRHGFIFIPVNGTASAPIVIRMDEPSHPGVLWGYGRAASNSDTWTGPDSNGVYKISRDLGQYIAQDMQLGDKGVVYLDEKTTATWTGSPGSFARVGGATYVKTTDGKSPAGRLGTMAIGYHFMLLRNQYIVFANGKYYGSYFSVDRDANWERVALPRSTNITIEGNIIKYSEGDMFQLYDGHLYWKFYGNTMEYAPNGIYTYGFMGGTGAHNMHVRGNIFRHMGVLMFPHQDAHALGFQRGDNHVIEYNYTEDTGEAITFWTGTTTTMKNHIIRYNVIVKPIVKRNTEGHAITISGESNDPLGNRTGIKIYGNVMINPQGNCFSSNSADLTEVYNNVCYAPGGAGIRISNANYPVSAKIVNNIIVNPKERFIDLATPANPKLTWDNNIYYSSIGAKPFRFYSSFSEWQQEERVDAHSLTVNPQFAVSNPTKWTDFKLAATSPAVNAGMDISGYVRDIAGGAVPTGARTDIGAFEYGAATGSVSPEPTATPTVNPTAPPSNEPLIYSLSPTSGPVSGGTTVTITGINFKSGARANIGGVNCRSTTFVSSTKVTCVTAATAAGTLDVFVYNTDGTSGMLPNSFTFR